MNRTKDWVLAQLSNFRSRRVEGPVLVIESDDWGAIRMPDTTVYESLKKSGLAVDQSSYDRVDCLESREDVFSLLEVLDQIRNSSGSCPVFTLNMIMGNPDFKKIKADDFSRFHHEDLRVSYDRYHGDSPVFELLEAVKRGVVVPQFHGREHLNLGLWLHDLSHSYSQTRLAFDHGFYGLTTKTSSGVQKNYLAAYWAERHSDLPEMRASMEDGIRIFRDVFGFTPKTMVPPNYVLPEELECVAARNGISAIQGQRGQLVPNPGDRSARIRRSYTGEKNSFGQIYMVRNVKFEPFENPSKDWVSSGLKEVSSAFSLGVPAIVSTHRANYVSGLSSANRQNSLVLLDQFLRQVVQRWPDTVFMSSDSLASMLEE